LEIEKDRGRRYGRAPDELIDFVETLRSRTPDLDPGKVLLSSLSSKAYLGGVDVSEMQGGLEQKANREGFVESATFNELKRFARYCVNWATIWRDFAVKERERAKIAKFRHELEKGQGGKIIAPGDQGSFAFRALRQGIQQLRKDPSAITADEVQNLASAAGLLEAEFKATRSDLVRFQLVASAATLSLLYHHEVQFLSSTLDSLAAELREAVEQFKGPLKLRCKEVLETLTASKDSLEALADLTQDMGVLDRKALATSLDLAMNVERAVARFKRVSDTYHIDITSRIPEGVLVGPMLKGELAAILLNVLSNSIKAVIAGGGGKSLVELHGYKAGRKVILEIKDTGIGLSSDERSTVFMPLVSDPSARLYDALEDRLDQSERQLLGQGSGLGLSIVRGVLERHDGSAAFVDPSAGWSTCLHLEFKAP
jgi:signal transduction histidine kinase